jgi:hypothetical protein
VAPGKVENKRAALVDGSLLLVYCQRLSGRIDAGARFVTFGCSRSLASGSLCVLPPNFRKADSATITVAATRAEPDTTICERPEVAAFIMRGFDHRPGSVGHSTEVPGCRSFQPKLFYSTHSALYKD